MRIAVLLLVVAAAARAQVPAEVVEAMAGFRSDGPRGWSFTQKTEGAGESMVERYDAAKPDFTRWVLLQKDGRPPTADELKDYNEMQSRRSNGGTGPSLMNQVDAAHGTVVSDTPERAVYRCPVTPGADGDQVAQVLVATVSYHKPTHTIDEVELASTAPFKPSLGVAIAEMRTTMSYTLPQGDQPSLITRVTTHLRGRAFWFKSLDADLTVEYSDYVRVTKAPQR
jgi:hypothetical protein